MKAPHNNLIVRRLQVLKDYLGLGPNNSNTIRKPAITKNIAIGRRKAIQEPEIKTLLWLDDRIDPLEQKMDWLSFSPIGKNVNVIWLKTYAEFTNWIQRNGLPSAVCFDDDLRANKNGVDCVQWLVDYCAKHRCCPPLWASHSTNPMSKAKINRLLKNYALIADRMKFSKVVPKEIFED